MLPTCLLLGIVFHLQTVIAVLQFLDKINPNAAIYADTMETIAFTKVCCPCTFTAALPTRVS